MLSPYRIIDLTDGPCLLAGLALSQLGAEVVTIEPEGGHRTRYEGIYSAESDPTGGSLWHDAYSRGRVALTGGPELIASLAPTADVVLDSGAHAIDLAELRATHPALITASVSPFGDDGPKASWAACDLTLSAASGQMVLNGDSDRAPVRISEPQAFHHASIEVAVHIAAALIERRTSGRGQHIDVSAQHALTQATQMQMLAGAVGAPLTHRHSGGLKIGPYELRFVYPALDGFVSITFLFGDMIGRFTQRLMEWVYDAGFCSETIRDLDYIRFFELAYSGELDPAALTEATDSVARYTSTLTKAELFQVARDQQLLIAPIATAHEVVGLDQFEARGYWERHPRSGGAESIRFPGPWARPAMTPLRPLGPPVAVGADNHRAKELAGRVVPTPKGSVESPVPSRPLDGMKVLDFSWVLAGPMATRLLADLGATVVRIESDQRPDVIRAAGPFMEGLEGGDATALWHSAAAGKLSLQLDVTSPASRAVVLDLARWADLAFESYSAGTIERLGFGYDVLSADNPSLVMLSTSLMGQDGPLADFAGFGNLAAALTGFFELTGWPDRAPAGPFTAYTDYVSPRFAALAAVAAVDHAQRTGQGQYIDLCQAEAAAHLLAPALLASQVEGREAVRRGNRDAHHAPHGVFPTGEPGDDHWIAIACTEDAQWRRLAAMLGVERLAELTRVERLERQDELDSLIIGWTTGTDGAEIEERLQAGGICAHRVLQSDGVLDDPQLRHRQFAQEVPHPRHGTVWVEGSQARWSRTQPAPTHGGPPVGEHTQHVLQDLLGYSDERIADLVVAGSIS